MSDAAAALGEIIEASGLIGAPSTGIALLSGGPDSACLAAGLASVIGADRIRGIHLNYGLREDSDSDEATCRELCEGLGIELAVEHPELAPGNVQDAARRARYEAAERLRAGLGAAWIATGHTRTDLAETVLYRLAFSPGRRALLGLPARQGRVVRPLLSAGRGELRALAAEAGLPFRDDPSNEDPRFARARLRHEVLPVLRELNPAAEENIAATRAELAEEAEALEAVAAEALAEAGAGEGTIVRAEALAELHPALRRLALRALAERVAGHDVSLGSGRAEAVWRLARSPEGGQVDLGGGLTAVCESGWIRITPQRPPSAGAPPAEPAALPVPGECRWGRWRLRAVLSEDPVSPAGPEVATLDAAALGGELEVRSWREGDRMRPLGLGGSKSLQDLFTDHSVPRSLRRELPVVTAAGQIAWVAGVAVAEEFKLGEGTAPVVLLSASALD